MFMAATYRYRCWRGHYIFSPILSRRRRCPCGAQAGRAPEDLRLMPAQIAGCCLAREPRHCERDACPCNAGTPVGKDAYA